MASNTDYTPTAQRFVDKVVIVTGGGAGIGYETARRFAAEGARVAIFDLDEKAAHSIADTIRADGGQALPVRVDMTDEDAVATAVATVLDTWGNLDVLVNNAGHGDPKFVRDMSVDEWDRMLTLNLRSVFLGSRAVWPTFENQGHGVILNASSITGRMAMFGLAAYGASKSAIATATRVMAIEGGRVGIRVNCVSPGYILTPGFQEFIDLQDDPTAFHDAMAHQSALRRFGSPGDVAEAYLYLASDAAGWVTGTDLVVDGGITAGQLPNQDPRAQPAG
ncbi:SDR family NAD(P)-dependent oxidoreductase [Rhodococcus sp. B50]|uniref:SDR family NAD(P)-dependent oxidoreductase n=1 Tax=Rhodococcus sp. B50 TaxID=2682847 RepID=UPI001BD50947|nr:SDR family NAD(P)-dependent oxidoreductase [Rhodococcus sp. B50]MBS9376504.1 Cyclopentanol dehydrogenase [Rhodococcus sp. B50]